MFNASNKQEIDEINGINQEEMPSEKVCSEKQIKIVVICNHAAALPSIDILLKRGFLVGLAVPAITSDHYLRVQFLAQEKEIPFIAIEENDLQNIVDWLHKCQPDVVFVISFPYKILPSILAIPQLGFLNFHLGLLPAYRSSDPIFWEIRNQEKQGGITVHLMDEKFNNGPIIHVEKVPIEKDLYGQHIQKLAFTVEKCTQHIIEIIQQSPNQLPLQPQDSKLCQYYKSPDFSDFIVDWTTYTASEIEALVQATNPTYGGAITFFRSVSVHLLQVEYLQERLESIQNIIDVTDVTPGTIVLVNNKGIVVACKNQELLRLEVTYTEDGFFTASKLAQTFSIKPGEIFTLAEELSTKDSNFNQT
jgi:methionyl-tRNA formyltransferase